MDRDDKSLQNSQQITSREISHLDGGYGWCIVFASFMVHITVYGVSWSVGVFNVIFLDEFGSSKAATAWAGSLLNAFMFGSGLLSSFLVKRFGCRWIVLLGGAMSGLGLALTALAQHLYVVYLTFSALTGVGLGLAYIPSVVIVSQYFVWKRTIALGLAVSGVGLGGFIYPALIWWLVDVCTWRMVMVIVGVVVFTTVTLFGSAMRPIQPELQRNVDIRTEVSSWCGFMRSQSFVVLCVNNLVYCLGLMVVYVHLGAFVKSCERFSSNHSAHVFSIIGISNLLGRVFHGVLCHFPRMCTVLVYASSSVLSGVATLAIPLCSEFTALAVCASMFGFFSACLGALLPDVIIRLVGKQQLSSGYGIILLFESAGSIVGGPLAGLLFDYTLIYDYSFYMAGSLLMCAGVLMLFPYFRLANRCPSSHLEINGLPRLTVEVGTESNSDNHSMIHQQSTSSECSDSYEIHLQRSPSLDACVPGRENDCLVGDGQLCRSLSLHDIISGSSESVIFQT